MTLDHIAREGGKLIASEIKLRFLHGGHSCGKENARRQKAISRKSTTQGLP